MIEWKRDMKIHLLFVAALFSATVCLAEEYRFQNPGTVGVQRVDGVISLVFDSQGEVARCTVRTDAKGDLLEQHSQCLYECIMGEFNPGGELTTIPVPDGTTILAEAIDSGCEPSTVVNLSLCKVEGEFCSHCNGNPEGDPNPGSVIDPTSANSLENVVGHGM